MVSFSVNPVIILSSVLSLVSIAIAVFSIIKYKELYHHYDMFMRGRDAETLEDFIYNEKEIKTIYRSPIFVGTGSIGYDKHREEI